MSHVDKAIVLFVGLPYTGKTALIQRMQGELPGKAILADEVFLRRVPPAEVSLSRWLEEGPHLVEGIQAIIREADETRFYVELGIMRARQRSDLIEWATAAGYSVLPLWLQCNDAKELSKRYRTRVQEIGEGGQGGGRIGITLDGLYRRICAAFEQPTAGEGFFVINTAKTLDECVAEIRQLVRSLGEPS